MYYTYVQYSYAIIRLGVALTSCLSVHLAANHPAVAQSLEHIVSILELGLVDVPQSSGSGRL